jgi:hypothetical protein
MGDIGVLYCTISDKPLRGFWYKTKVPSQQVIYVILLHPDYFRLPDNMRFGIDIEQAKKISKDLKMYSLKNTEDSSLFRFLLFSTIHEYMETGSCISDIFFKTIERYIIYHKSSEECLRLLSKLHKMDCTASNASNASNAETDSETSQIIDKKLRKIVSMISNEKDLKDLKCQDEENLEPEKDLIDALFVLIKE